MSSAKIATANKDLKTIFVVNNESKAKALHDNNQNIMLLPDNEVNPVENILLCKNITNFDELFISDAIQLNSDVEKCKLLFDVFVFSENSLFPKSDFSVTKQDIDKVYKNAKSAFLYDYACGNVIADRMLYKKDNAPKSEPIQTGFLSLDKALRNSSDGKLVVLGAGSSVGKTTLAVQIGDTIAAAGKPVLFFSLETSKELLVAKSISRIIWMTQSPKVKTIVDSDDIFMQEISIDKKNEINRGKSIYCSIETGKKPLYFDQYNKIDEICKIVKDFCEIKKTSPVVIIDYLQIIDPCSLKVSGDKQAVDMILSKLLELKINNKVTILALSSINRESYDSPVEMRSLKESGRLEYDANVLIGMNLVIIDEASRDSNPKISLIEKKRKMEAEEKIKRENNELIKRDVSVKILKNKTGPIESFTLHFFPQINLFIEDFSPSIWQSFPEDVKSKYISILLNLLTLEIDGYNTKDFWTKYDSICNKISSKDKKEIEDRIKRCHEDSLLFKTKSDENENLPSVPGCDENENLPASPDCDEDENLPYCPDHAEGEDPFYWSDCDEDENPPYCPDHAESEDPFYWSDCDEDENPPYCPDHAESEDPFYWSDCDEDVELPF